MNTNLIGISGKIKSGKDTVATIIQGLELSLDRDQILHAAREGERFKGSTWKIRKFADKLKEIVCLLIGCSREDLEDQEFKEKPLGKEWWYHRAISFGTPQDIKMFPYSETSEEEAAKYCRTEETLGTPYDYDLIKLTPRKLLQLLGTEAGREIIHPNIWVNALFADYKSRRKTTNLVGRKQEVHEYPNWIISDMRFPNEAQAVKDRRGLLIRIKRGYPDGIYKIDDNLYTGSGGMENFDQAMREEAGIKEHLSETALDDWQDWDYKINNNGTLLELIDKVRDICRAENMI